MKYNKLIGFLCFSACLTACQEEQLPQENLLSGAGISTKVVRWEGAVEDESFLVKFSEVPTAELLRTLMADKEVMDVTPLFPSCAGKEELEKKHGLDRWYQVFLRGGANLDAQVLSLAARGDVVSVEYNVRAENEKTTAYAAQPPIVTKAAFDTFNDPYLTDQWHYYNRGEAIVSPNAIAGADVNVKDVWENLCTGDPSIVVAVVDEGVKYNHPDLKDNMWVNSGEIPGNGIDDDGNGYIDDIYGYNFVDNGPITWDKVDADGEGDSGHGTHCAGTIAAVNNNGKGVAGIAGGSGKGDGCRIMSCQVFSGPSGGSVSALSKAVKYAADMGASVMSASLGYKTAFTSDNNYISRQGSAEIDAIHYFEESKNNDVLDGGIAIFAAGNEGHNYAHYPGAFYDIISVSAFGPDFLPAYYTNYGPGCNISAPGGEAYHISNVFRSMVLSTVPSELRELTAANFYQTGQDYAYMQGTSMACPHVTGVVALALSYAHQLGKRFSVSEFKQMILSSVNDIDQRIANTESKSYAYYKSPLSMTPYYHQMGTGAIDAWRLMMHVEGVPSLTAQLGKKQWIDLTSVFGTASVSLTYLNVEVSSAAASSMGLEKIEPANADKYPVVMDEGNYAYVQFGRLYIHPTKVGSGKIKIHAVGGGGHVGGGNNPPGGMELVREVSLIARDTDGKNGNGGWL